MTAEEPRAPGGIPWDAWAVHVYTATGAVLAFLAVREVFAGDFRTAFVWLFVAVVIDATDGSLSRLARVHERLPHVSGEKLDDLVDYLTFVFVRIGYIYPSRTPALRPLTVTLTALRGALVLAIIVTLPSPSPWLVWLSLVFPAYYVILSVALHARRSPGSIQ